MFHSMYMSFFHIFMIVWLFDLTD